MVCMCGGGVGSTSCAALFCTCFCWLRQSCGETSLATERKTMKRQEGDEAPVSGKLPKVPKVDTVRLNVGGRLFETCAELSVPRALLTDLALTVVRSAFTVRSPRSREHRAHAALTAFTSTAFTGPTLTASTAFTRTRLAQGWAGRASGRALRSRAPRACTQRSRTPRSRAPRSRAPHS